jgi:hypothetical protein
VSWMAKDHKDMISLSLSLSLSLVVVVVRGRSEVGVYMRADTNCPHSLSAPISYPLSAHADADSKNQYPQVQFYIFLVLHYFKTIPTD